MISLQCRQRSFDLHTSEQRGGSIDFEHVSHISFLHISHFSYGQYVSSVYAHRLRQSLTAHFSIVILLVRESEGGFIHLATASSREAGGLGGLGEGVSSGIFVPSFLYFPFCTYPKIKMADFVELKKPDGSHQGTLYYQYPPPAHVTYLWMFYIACLVFALILLCACGNVAAWAISRALKNKLKDRYVILNDSGVCKV